MPGLTNAVRMYRLQLMRDFMRSGGYDALAFTGADWFEWAGNHAVSDLAWERPFLLVVPLSGPSFAIMSELGRHQVGAEAQRGTLWIDSVSHYCEAPGGGWLQPQWSEMVAEALRGAGLARARIGADGLPGPFARVARGLPGVSVTVSTETLRPLRRIKHPDEIATMRIAGSLNDWAMNQFREEIRPGRLVAEVDYLVCARLATEAARRVPTENFTINKILTLSGPTSACPHGDGALVGKVFEKDSVSVTAIATKLNGLATELARPWLVWSPDARTISLYDCALAAQTAGIEAAVAGRPVCGIHGAARDVIQRAGFDQLFRLRAGHGIGVVMHDFPHNLPFEQRSLVEGETYVVEPGLYLPEIGGFRFADALVVGTADAEQLTRCSKDRPSQTI